MIRRRALLSALAALSLGPRAFAQPVPLGAGVGGSRLGSGPLYGGSGGGPPTFDLNLLGGSLGAGAVITRASTAAYFDSTGVIRTAAANAPRFDYDPATLVLNGVLLEEGSTNNCLFSDDFSNAAWFKSGGGGVGSPVVIANSVAAPDGTLTADQLNYPAVSVASSLSIAFQQITFQAKTYTISAWLRGAAGGEHIYFAVASGAPLLTSPRFTLTTTWQRFIFTTPVPAALRSVTIGTDLRDPAQAATLAQTVYMWGVQVEALPYASSYIPTISASVDRAADALSYPIANVTGFQVSKGTIALDYIIAGAQPGLGISARFVGTTPGANYISVDEFTGPGGTGTAPTLSRAADVVGGSSVATAVFNQVPVPAGVVHYGASSWASGAVMKAAHDGVGAISASGAAAILPTVVNLTIAQTPVSLWLRRVRYWPRALSQSELNGATTP